MSVRFDATTDQLTRASPPSISAGFTMTCWAYVSVDRDDFQTIGRVHASGTTIVTWATLSDGLGGPNYFTAGGSVNNTTNFTVGTWRKVAIACTGTTAKSYVQDPGNATEADSGTVTSSGTPTELAIGGRGSDANEWWNGRIAYYRVWSTELSQAEIEAEWNSPTPVRTSNLWADWPLTVHTDLTDHSGNGRNLTAGSSAVTTEADPPLATSATAGSAAIAMTARTPQVTVSPNVGSATTAMTARAPQASVRPSAGAATFALAGQGATTAVSPSAGAATAATTARTPQITVAPSAGSAGIGMAGQNASVSTSLSRTAGMATWSLSAEPVQTLLVSTSIAAATFGMAGQNAVASTVTTYAPAGAAALGLVAHPATTTISTTVGSAAIDLDALNGFVFGGTTASGGNAPFGLTARTPQVSLRVTAGAAGIGLLAADVTSSAQSIACAVFVTLVAVDQHFGAVVPDAHVGSVTSDAHAGSVVLDEHYATAGICGRS